MLRISIERDDALSEDERIELRALSAAVYPPSDVEWPGNAIEWAASEWRARGRDERGRLMCHVGMVARAAFVDGRPVHVGGIGGVMTHPSARRRGHARDCIDRAISYLGDRMGLDFGLLVCEPTLIDYYSSQGWREFSGRLVVQQGGREEHFTFNRVMVCDIGSAAPASGVIDLAGPPW